MYIRSCFFCLIVLLSFTACDSQQYIFSDEELSFFQSKADTDKERVLALSNQVYSGSPKCSLELDCPELCRSIYSVEDKQKECINLKAQQVYQLEKLYKTLFEKKLSTLEKMNVFDLKVFFNIDSEPLFHFFKSLDLFSLKVFFKWIALNWQIAQVFQEEDSQSLFLRIFLKKIADNPINSLKEPILEDRTFVELAWLKQNDFALLWLQDYFQTKRCSKSEEKELDNCILAQYCLVSDSFKPDISKEFVELKFVKDNIKEGYKDFKSFCSEFCLSPEGQSYCA